MQQSLSWEGQTPGVRTVTNQARGHNWPVTLLFFPPNLTELHAQWFILNVKEDATLHIQWYLFCAFGHQDKTVHLLLTFGSAQRKSKPLDWFATGIKRNTHTPKTKQYYLFMFIMFIHTNVTTFLHFTHETVRNIEKNKEWKAAKKIRLNINTSALKYLFYFKSFSPKEEHFSPSPWQQLQYRHP